MVTMGCGRIGDDRAGCSGLAAEGHMVAKRIASITFLSCNNCTRRSITGFSADNIILFIQKDPVGNVLPPNERTGEQLASWGEL